MRIPFNDLQRSYRSVNAELEDALSRVVRSGVFFFGEETEALKSELGEYLESEFVVPVGNGTDALEIALLALGVGPNDGVVTVANAGGYGTSAILKCGAKPIYVDVTPSSLQMDIDNLDRTLQALDKKPSALVLTHLYGYMAPAKEIVKLCRKYSISVVEDCAQAIGVRDNEIHVGRFGDIGTISFYPTKNLGGVGDSGAIFTSDLELSERAHQLSQYGWSEKYHTQRRFGRNSRMDEIQAAILRLNLPKTENNNKRRTDIIGYLAESSETLLFPHLGNHPFNGHLAIVFEDERENLRQFLAERGIQTAIHYPVPDHKQVAWCEPDVKLENTEVVAEKILSLPAFPALSDIEVEYMGQALLAWTR